MAVGKFTSTGAFSSKYGSWDIGGGLSAMLVSALVESQRFIVVERANLQRVLSEKELKGAGLVNKSTGPGPGKLIGVQMFIHGAVTEFGTDDEGGGFSIGGSGGGIGSLLSGALSSQSSGGSLAIDFRVVDSTTGQIIETHRIREPIDSSSFDLSLGYQGVNFGTNKFYKTPIGQAARRLITKAVQKIAVNAGNLGWSGQVVDFDGKEIYINAGARSGIKKDDVFMVERVIKRLTDPTTGEVLSIRKKELGIVKIIGVESKVSFGSFQPLETIPPQRGDFVAIMKK
ncbi:MAG: CsgG/HfaB family protein [Rhodospirillales bacterium]